ncbi:hypothetical protein L6164_001997 [Bauhinia variegata]|uniref:Uncharacterized protein n=1 Tax=Bauhinia variegata TaxID=167791 RepID=A0ACB9PYB8_BAUVA|nr:hypothetical protein L6164_001997 [Bauhinia variegata]
MSGLYNPNFSPARAASPQIRTTPDVDRKDCSFLQSILIGVASRASEAWTLHAGPSDMQSTVKSRSRLNGFSCANLVCGLLHLRVDYPIHHILIALLAIRHFGWCLRHLRELVVAQFSCGFT